MNLKECIKKVSRLVVDDEVRKLVFDNRFDKDEFLTTVEEINGYFSNILNLTFALLYAKFRKWKEEDGSINADDSEKFNSYMRVNKTFADLYIAKNLSFSTIEPTIMDAQLDMYYHGVLWEKLNLESLLRQDKNNRFASFIQKAKIARASSRGLQGQESLESKYDELIEFLMLFPYLSSSSLEYTPISQEEYGKSYLFYEMGDDSLEKFDFDDINKVKIVIEDVEDEKLDTYLTLLKVGEDFYFLEEVIFDNLGIDKKEIIYLNYSHVGSESNFLRINATADDNYIGRNGELLIVSPKAIRTIVRELRINAKKEDKLKIIIKDFYAINYRYVKQLTLSVSDILTAENKIAFKNNYGCKYPELFEHVWDTIIAILIVKESGTSILQFLFSIDEKAYTQLLYNLQMRFGAEVFNAAALENEAKQQVESAFQRWVHKYFGENRESEEKSDVSNKVIEAQRIAITSEVRATLLIEYLSDLLKINEAHDDKNKSKYPLNINSHILMLEWLTKADLMPERKKERAISIVLNTLKSLYVFYSGFFKYVAVKKEFRDKSTFKIFTSKEIDEFQRNANSVCCKEAMKQVKRLSQFGSGYDAVLKVLEEIRKLNYECTFVKGHNTKNEILKEYIGRHQLLNFSQIAPLAELLKFSGADGNFEIDETIKRIILIYRYLQNGNDKECGMDGIYPYVGTYEYTHETRDGYRIAHFSISTPMRDEDIDIEILSEFKYSINSKYYCLPNKMCGSNEIKLWIEPTIVDYKNFVMVDGDE